MRLSPSSGIEIVLGSGIDLVLGSGIGLVASIRTTRPTSASLGWDFLLDFVLRNFLRSEKKCCRLLWERPGGSRDFLLFFVRECPMQMSALSRWIESSLVEEDVTIIGSRDIYFPDRKFRNPPDAKQVDFTDGFCGVDYPMSTFFSFGGGIGAKTSLITSWYLVFKFAL